MGNVQLRLTTDLRKLIIGVFRGGVSSERDISLLSGQNVIRALRKRKYKVVDIDLKTKNGEEIIEIIRRKSIDIVFIALHGEFGEDGGIQKILEENNIPFTGSNSHSSFLAMDKIKTHNLFKENNIPTPEYWIEDEGLPHFLPSDFPLVIKPHYAGSTLGVSIVRKNSELKEAIEKAKNFSSKVLVERYIEGRELTVGIVGEIILPIIEMKFKKALFDFSCKYEENLTEFIVPAKLPQDIYDNIKNLAYKVFKVLGCRGFGRVDLRIDKKFNPYILELNSIPGLTSHSLLPLAAKEAGLSFEDLCEEILKEAVKTAVGSTK